MTCFLPCRKGSERVPRKNIRPIAGRDWGLLEIKLEQLLSSQLVDRVLLSTNDPDIMSYAATLRDDRLEVVPRADSLASSSTSTDDLIGYVSTLVPDGHVLWTHVTSPFLTAAHYDEMIRTYHRQLGEGFDSLMSVSEVRSFLWNEVGPVNYDRGVEKWPRTQTLEPLYEINSAAFLAPAAVYQKLHDRIGERPFKYVLDKIVGFDIDWEDDFLIAQAMLSAGIGKV